jgi:adenosylcobinamide-GDP ribazoletransferase
MIRRFLSAIQFLTVVPVHRETASPGAAAVFFPLTGALLGATAGTVLLLSRMALDRSISALLAVAWLLVVTGCLHEDGLADVADAVRAGRSRQKMLDILKDSRIGTYGAVALILSVGMRWQSLVVPATNPVPGLTAALCLSRASLVALAAVTPAVGGGMGEAFAKSCTRHVLLGVLTQAVAIAGLMSFFADWRTMAIMIAASAVVVLLARVFFVRRLGGVNGDCLGATCQAVEVVNLVILTWHLSI